ncbi:unnamed protein product [Phytophthora fragariaefolia]|uniref:Unnamed protein product n=1 Tax=Phytophthora fragariaefolia TaxID=1490495 RepID=A0A9W6XYN6_9STRA|nr:unnamed protein product [Phytophthora fragariaefolia]
MQSVRSPERSAIGPPPQIPRGFADLANVEFYSLCGDAKDLAVYIVKNDGRLILAKIETLEKDVPRNMQMIDEKKVTPGCKPNLVERRLYS